MNFSFASTLPAPTARGDVTPWGDAQTVTEIRRGDARIAFVSTGSHGGYYVPDELLGRIPEAHQAYARSWSGSNNWYEEDCAWAYVALALPEFFPEKAIEAAKLTAEYIEEVRA